MANLYDKIAASEDATLILDLLTIYVVFAIIKSIVKRKEQSRHGQLLLEVYRYPWMKYLAGAEIVFSAVCAFFVLLSCLLKDRVLDMIGLFAILLLLIFVTYLSWGRTGICEKGVVVRNKLYEWEYFIRRERISDEQVIAYARYGSQEHAINIYHQPQQREAIDALLREKISQEQ